MSTEERTFTKLDEFATEYFFQRTWKDDDKRNVFITRHSNHGNWIEGGNWVVCVMLGAMNPWYLGEGGLWRYKYGWQYETPEIAYTALAHSKSLNASIEAAT